MNWVKPIAAFIMLAIAGPALAHDSQAHNTAAQAHTACKTLTHQDAKYTVCQFDPETADIRLFLKDDQGDVFGGFNAVNSALAKTGERLSFAMNAGMYLSLIHI